MGARKGLMRKATAKRIRLIKSCRLYSTAELAESLGVHRRTVQQWQKLGLDALDPYSRPFLFRGSGAKAFLSDLRRKRKTTLKDGEFYCLVCRQPRMSAASELTSRPLGNPSSPKHRLHIKGKCIQCCTGVNRIMSASGFEASVLKVMVTQAEVRLSGGHDANVNTDTSKEQTDE